MSQAAAIDSLSSQLQSLLVVTKNDEAARKQLFHITMGAAMQFESPLDTCWRIIMFVKMPLPVLEPYHNGFKVATCSCRYHDLVEHGSHRPARKVHYIHVCTAHS